MLVIGAQGINGPTLRSQVCGELNGAKCLVKRRKRSSALIVFRTALQDVIAQAVVDLQNLTEIGVAVQEGIIQWSTLKPAAPPKDCSSSSPMETPAQ